MAKTKGILSATERLVGSDEPRPAISAGSTPRKLLDPTQFRNDPEPTATDWSTESEFAVQLLLDPHVIAVQFRASLPLLGQEVPIEMFVAELADGSRAAFDVIDERQHYRDLDAEGLLLLALESHGVRLIEIDRADIDEEPRASNARRVWSYRARRVPSHVKAAIDRVLTTRRLTTIGSLANRVGLSDPIPTVSALASQGVLAIDLCEPLDSNSVVGRRSDPWRFPIARSSRLRRTNQ